MRVVAEGLRIGESPRWHDGRLWVSDMGAGELLSIDAGETAVALAVPAMPMGLGVTPGGELVVVSSGDGRLLRLDGSTYADLTALGRYPWSDMVIDGRGNAYVGNINFDFAGGEPRPGFLALVTPDGTARTVADDLQFPNGVAVTPDNRTLIVAETYAHRLTAFDIAGDGSLGNRRVFADLGEEAYPDGICLDADGAVWYADVPNRHCRRVTEGGAVRSEKSTGHGAFACVLNGQTLYIVTADWRGGAIMTSNDRTGRVICFDVEIPGAGWP